MSKTKAEPKSEPSSRQTSEFENFANAVKTIMAVPKTAIDAHKPIRPRQRVNQAKQKTTKKQKQATAPV